MEDQIRDILKSNIFASTNPTERSVKIHGFDRSARLIAELIKENMDHKPTEHEKQTALPGQS